MTDKQYSARQEQSGRAKEMLMQHFCRPDPVEETEAEQKLLAGAEMFDVPFEGRTLKCYAWGHGKTVLLVHGWGSRAGHMAFLARSLARAGYRAIAFDGPAHGRSVGLSDNGRSSLPEFCRAIYHLSRRIGPLFGLIGHSFGGAAACFCVAGQANIAGYRVEVSRLALVAAPAGIAKMIQYFCAGAGFDAAVENEITSLLEEEFPLAVKDYEVSDALGRINAKVLVVHDRDDREVAYAAAAEMVAGHHHVRLVSTSGEGHRRILISRTLVRAMRDFLDE